MLFSAEEIFLNKYNLINSKCLLLINLKRKKSPKAWIFKRMSLLVVKELSLIDVERKEKTQSLN